MLIHYFQLFYFVLDIEVVLYFASSDTSWNALPLSSDDINYSSTTAAVRSVHFCSVTKEGANIVNADLTLQSSKYKVSTEITHIHDLHTNSQMRMPL